ncbi:MAG: ACP S-malonyltransferase [Sedimentisphaerales bacterium]|nr:ACP S-malonyltransferase [Sedimentisphaerales bacterium]MBN2841980.1 ACP S-malonyltransferase [Sedimentisphaerales bacterium]
MKTLFMFPGQGAQNLGMGKEFANDIAEVKALYQQSSDILGYDLADLCFNGPQEKLNLTEYAQPAIFVTSIAHLTALRLGKVADISASIQPEACAGLSLGEYTALHVAGVLSFEDALRLVQLRGQSMQQAAESSRGTMVSILGLDEQTVTKLCQDVLAMNIQEENGPAILSAVNFNCPGQVVVSGTINACQKAAEIAASYGAMKAVPLQVAGAFHTDMMAPAAARLATAIDNCKINEPTCPVISNVDTMAYNGSGEVKDKLMKQLVGAVRWQQSIEKLLEEGFDQFVEIGPGRVLSGLVKKTSRDKKMKVEIINV